MENSWHNHELWMAITFVVSHHDPSHVHLSQRNPNMIRVEFSDEW